MIAAEQITFHSLLFPGRKVLYVAEVAERLDLTDRHVINLIEEGLLKAINVGGDNTSGRRFYRIPIEAYEEYLRARTL